MPKTFYKKCHNNKYSGGPLSDDGRIFRELNARIGVATGDFEKFSRIWGPALLANEGSDLETLSDEPMSHT